MDMHKKQGPDRESAESSLFDMPGFCSVSSPIGLVITDPGGVIISFNKTVQDLLGVRIEDYRNANVCDLYANPNDRQRLMDMLALSGSVRNFEVELKHANGTLRTVLANIDSVELSGEHVLLTSFYDITQYVEQQKSRIRAGDDFRALFSDAPIGITVTDVKGNLVVSNNAIKELLGYGADELTDLSMRDFYIHADDRKQLLELRSGLAACGTLKQCSGKKTERPWPCCSTPTSSNLTVSRICC
jgi:PAS domain S-box-containing protein